MRTLADWLALQQAAHPRHIDMGLERVASVARRLGVERPAPAVITVAGTNGKGSTCAHLEALLRAARSRVGLFTSPHFIRYNERIRVDGAEVGDAELIAAFERIEQARGGVSLTFFEYNALAALLIFRERAVDIAVLEVGLGGRLDATNLVDADVAVLCSVGFDHRDWLGDSLEAIGAEKAGIFRPGRPAVLGTSELPASVFARIDEIGARALVAGRDFDWSVGAGDWSYRGLRHVFESLPPPALAGEIQYRNAATALAAVEALDEKRVLDGHTVSEALRSVRLAGRFQIVPGPVEWILDIAHNEPAAAVFASHLRARPCSGRTIAVVGILRDKDAEGIAGRLRPLVDQWILCSLSAEPRAMSAAELGARLDLPAGDVTLADSVEEGCERARSITRPGDRVIVFGSCYAVGPALQWLRIY